MEGREKNAETQAGCHRHVLHRILAAASPKRKCDRIFKVTSPAAHTHLTRARCHGLANSKVECRSFKLIYDLDPVTLVHWHFPHPDKPACRWYAVSAVRADIAFPDRRSAPAAR